MHNDILPEALAREAADMDTSPKRLEELSHNPRLHKLIAANPATSPAVLGGLSVSKDDEVRRAVAQNPNTSLKDLCTLAAEFPGEFLGNPIITIMNMTHSNFIKDLPRLTWGSLLRYENIPSFWLKQLQKDTFYQRRQPAIWGLIRLHVKLADKVNQPDFKQANQTLRDYRKQIPKPKAVNAADELFLFTLFVLLFPFAAKMLKKEWIEVLQTPARQGLLALTTCTRVNGKLLARLSSEQDISLLCNIARHPRTYEKTLRYLATYPKVEVRRAVASNPRISLPILQKLASDSNATVRRTAASQRGLTMDDLAILALDSYQEVRAAVATHSRLSPEIFQQLTVDSDATVRTAIARNTKVSGEILSLLAHDSEPQVRSAAAGNPRLPLDALTTLLTDADVSVRAAIAGNARLPGSFSVQLAQDSSPIVRRYLAANPRIPISLLEILYQEEEIEVWRGVVHHPGATPAMLTQLAIRGDLSIRAAVAAHSKTSVETLHILAKENAREIWRGLVTNPHTPIVILEQAASAAIPELWPLLINHPEMRRHQCRPLVLLLARKLQQLVSTNCLPVWFRRVVYQYYTALPTTILEAFLVSPFWEDRYLIAHHPSMPEATLQVLAHDGNCYVHVVAEKRLNKQQA